MPGELAPAVRPKAVIFEPAGTAWDVAARLGDCWSYFGCKPATTVFVSNRRSDLITASTAGAMALEAHWAGEPESEREGFDTPAELAGWLAGR